MGGIRKLWGALRRGAAGTCASESELQAYARAAALAAAAAAGAMALQSHQALWQPQCQSCLPAQVAGCRTLLAAVLTTNAAAASGDRQLQAALPQSTPLDGPWHEENGAHDPPSHLHSIKSTPSSGFRHIEFTRRSLADRPRSGLP